MKLFNKVLVFCAIFFVFIPSFQETEAEQLPGNSEVSLTKHWTVEFNTRMDPETINEETVYIRDTSGKKMSGLQFILSEDEKELKVYTSDVFRPDTRYVLHITKGVKSIEGIPLQENITFPFQTEDLQEEPLTPKEIVHKNDHKVVMVQASDGWHTSQGSGFFVTEGIIATNFHVVQGMSEIQVRLNNGNIYEVEGVVDYDIARDVALLKLERELSIHPVELADSIKVEKGDQVYSIGSPLGLQNTLSDGLISGIREQGLLKLIQINVPVDAGSSGGPLFNDHGDVIGITSEIIAGTQADLNFAVPINDIKPLIEKIEGQPFAKVDASFPDVPGFHNMHEFLNEKFGEMKTSEGAFTIQFTPAYMDFSGYYVIEAYIEPDQYEQYQDEYDSIKEEVQEWGLAVGDYLDQNFPRSYLDVDVYYAEEFDEYPDEFPEEWIQETEDKWFVINQIIEVLLSDQIYVETYQ
ncbi:MAG: trypsin-like peptidase domain-containing protein [Bacillaceae bacterium]|nr:trypsin-like peptidase domain-containing protein [Bacillaceae bacterium]